LVRGFIDILGDKWKSKQIELYDVHKTPLLDHYRLRVRECKDGTDNALRRLTLDEHSGLAKRGVP
jgi:hypothetical protein